MPRIRPSSGPGENSRSVVADDVHYARNSRTASVQLGVATFFAKLGIRIERVMVGGRWIVENGQIPARRGRPHPAALVGGAEIAGGCNVALTIKDRVGGVYRDWQATIVQLPELQCALPLRHLAQEAARHSAACYFTVNVLRSSHRPRNLRPQTFSLAGGAAPRSARVSRRSAGKTQ